MKETSSAFATGLATLSPRRAAIVAGVVYLANPVTMSEFVIWPRLVIDGDLGRTIENLSNHQGLFITAILCYLANFIGDIVMAWALYALLAPVDRALSMLASWFQLVFACMALTGIFDLLAVHNLLHSPDYLKAFGLAQRDAQILLHLRAFHNDFDLALTIFGLHLLVVSALIARATYIPRLLALPVAAAGLGWIVNFIGPYYRPDLNFGLATIMASGELFLTAWLLLRGWKIAIDPPIPA